MELIWTEQANKDYFANIDFLMGEWSLQVTEAFVNQVKKTLRSLLIFPEMYPQSSYKT